MEPFFNYILLKGYFKASIVNKKGIIYADKRGRYCFQMDEILDPETVSNVTVFGETFSIE